MMKLLFINANTDESVGVAELPDNEARHFIKARFFTGSVALTQEQLDALELVGTEPLYCTPSYTA